MGLDITYYEAIAKLDCHYTQDGEPIEPGTGELINDYTELYPNPHFLGHADGIEKGTYRTSGESDGFRAGSYGGYNNWREELARFAGYPSMEEERYGQKQMRHDAGAYHAGAGPFYELIYFSDCEGVIGPKTSAKLAKDFDDFAEKAASHSDEYWRGKYAEWRKAFTVASKGGCVAFH